MLALMVTETQTLLVQILCTEHLKEMGMVDFYPISILTQKREILTQTKYSILTQNKRDMRHTENHSQAGLNAQAQVYFSA